MTEEQTQATLGGGRDRPYRATLKPGRERSVERRHPWIFAGAVANLEATEDAQPGDLGSVWSASGVYLGVGVVNPAAQLTIRLLRFEDGAVDGAWFVRQVRRAAALRDQLAVPETSALRLINAEGDGLPGLIVDRYGDYLVVQCASLGMARLEPLWLRALEEVLAPRGILDRSEKGRSDINLARRDALLAGEAPAGPIEIREYGVRFRVDLAAGQKTGFYLDQRENRHRLAALARDRRVLNAFAYSGGFGIHAGSAGAARVVGVETSAAALDLARANWELNGLPAEKLRLVRGSVQDFLRREDDLYDLIILDPPAFAKERRHVAKATRAYKDINLWALKRLAPGGYLATFSCSQHVGVDLFQKVVFGAALDAAVPLQWLARLGAGPDHPVHLDHPQGEYLKGLLLRSLAAGKDG